MAPPTATVISPKLELQESPDANSDIRRRSSALHTPTEQGLSSPSPPTPDAGRSSELVRVEKLDEERSYEFRRMVRRARMTYEALRLRIARGEDVGDVPIGGRKRPDLKAGKLMKLKGMWLHRERRIVGDIPGVFVGDQFFYRMELCVVGLHGQSQGGIDTVTPGLTNNGDPIATSIIVSGGYEDDEDSGDVLTYTGQGGKDLHLTTQRVHQQLKGGNLALERSMFHGIEIRVIRGFDCEASPSGKVYIYDGLYKVTNYWYNVGKSGFSVYKYKLVRLANQPEMGTKVFKFADELKTRPLTVRPAGFFHKDLSEGKEKLPVYFYNDVDDDHSPLNNFDYAVSSTYTPNSFAGIRNVACECVDRCSGCECDCIMKNGGKVVYNDEGVLLRGRPVVFECGELCKCSMSCGNRVSQRGLKHRLEVFRSRDHSTSVATWGVRSLDPIRAGEFICEYSGLVINSDKVAAMLNLNGDQYKGLIHPTSFPSRWWMEWGDISAVAPRVRNHVDFSEFSPFDFAVDVSRVRNVACYVCHSRCPNVMVQVVAYSHNSMVCPHLVLYSLESIPPLRDLSVCHGITKRHAHEDLCADIKPPKKAKLLCKEGVHL